MPIIVVQYFLDFIDAVDSVGDQWIIMGLHNSPVTAKTKNACKEVNAL